MAKVCMRCEIEFANHVCYIGTNERKQRQTLSSLHEQKKKAPASTARVSVVVPKTSTTDEEKVSMLKRVKKTVKFSNVPKKINESIIHQLLRERRLRVIARGGPELHMSTRKRAELPPYTQKFLPSLEQMDATIKEVYRLWIQRLERS